MFFPLITIYPSCLVFSNVCEVNIFSFWWRTHFSIATMAAFAVFNANNKFFSRAYVILQRSPFTVYTLWLVFSLRCALHQCLLKLLISIFFFQAWTNIACRAGLDNKKIFTASCCIRLMLSCLLGRNGVLDRCEYFDFCGVIGNDLLRFIYVFVFGTFLFVVDKSSRYSCAVIGYCLNGLLHPCHACQSNCFSLSRFLTTFNLTSTSAAFFIFRLKISVGYPADN